MDFPHSHEYEWGYYSLETEHFWWRVYKFAGGGNRPVTYRAEMKVKKEFTKYVLRYEDFAELDYKDASDAFAAAKKWIHSCAESVLTEISEAIEFT